MDPNANLKEQLELAAHLAEMLPDIRRDEDIDRLCELVLALDGWIRNGGFLPQEWAGRKAYNPEGF